MLSSHPFLFDTIRHALQVLPFVFNALVVVDISIYKLDLEDLEEGEELTRPRSALLRAQVLKAFAVFLLFIFPSILFECLFIPKL